MKKTIVTIVGFLSLIAAPTILKAQTFAIGPKVGFVASSFQGDDVNNESFRKGLQFGAFFTAAPTEWFSVQPEILFDQRGSNEVIYDNVSREININYLTIPVGLSFRIPVAQTFYPKVMGGPYFAFAVNDQQRQIGNLTLPGYRDTDVRRIDGGGFLGAGLDIQHNNLFATFDVRYLFGAVDVSKDNNLEFRNTQVATSAGIGFKF